MSTTGTRFRAKSPATEQLAAASLLIANTLFAAGGLAGHSHPVIFGLLYLLSAAAAIPAVYFLIVAVAGRGSGLVSAGAFVFGLSALGHAAEGAITMTDSLARVGRAGPMLGFAETVTLIAGMMLIGIGLWRARITAIWPVLILLLIVPADAMPHGIAQQTARSTVLILVTILLARPLARSRLEVPAITGTLPAGDSAHV